MLFEITITAVQIQIAGYVDFMCTLQKETTEGSGMFEDFSGQPDRVRLPISTIYEIATDDIAYPDRAAKLVELRSRVLSAARALPVVQAVARQDQLVSALPDLPFSTTFDFPE